MSGALMRDHVNGRGNASGRMRGAVVGIVTNNKDPENRARIKVRFPWLDDALESHWARVTVFYAGPGRGGYIMPEVGDEVLVMFEEGDPNLPYVVGSLWNGKDQIPGPGNLDGKNDTKMFQSRSGHKLIFSDKGGAEKVTFVNNNGKLKLEIDVAADTITFLATTGDIFFKAQQGPITLTCTDMKINATKSTTVTVGDGLAESSSTRSETIGANDSATAKQSFTIATKVMSVSFGSGAISTASASMSVDAASMQTIGQLDFEGAVVSRTSGPETLTAGTLELHASDQIQMKLSGPATLTAGMTQVTSSGDAVIHSSAALTVMGGMIMYDGGATISVSASLVTLC